MATDQLSLVFGALADPVRRTILTRLGEGDATVGELAAPFRISQPAISRHLKVLEKAGLISRSRRATARLSRLEAEPLREVTTWLARYQQFWDESHERLDDLLAALQGAQDAQDPGDGKPHEDGGREDTVPAQDQGREAAVPAEGDQDA
jgi:DNA-binding transcriptional ArsR family regulator